jgi:hypothetical protein
MYLIELIAQKKMYDQKIREVRKLLEVRPSEELAYELLDLLEIRQGKLISINRANEQSTLNLGGTDITITLAVMIRDTIKAKMDVLTKLINNPENGLDKIKLLEQRDKHFNEYTLISMGITKNDLNVKVG